MTERWTLHPHRGSAAHDRVTSWLLHLTENSDDWENVSKDDTWGEIYGAGENVTDEMTARAQLVATAPDLLAACIAAEKYMSHHEVGAARALRVVRAAIAKAEQKPIASGSPPA